MKKLIPPVAPKIPHKTTVHGDTRVDPYYWMREKTNPAVISYLKAENRFTEKVMKPYEALVDRLNGEMVKRLVEDDSTVPVMRGGFLYYSRQSKGLQYPVYCRKAGTPRSRQQVILDVNELARGKKYMRVGDFEVSPDSKLAAFSTDTKGDEVFTIRVKDLTTGKLLADTISGAYYSMAWSNDNRTLFYTTVDEALRPYRVWRHKLGTGSKEDQIVWEEKDERFTVMVGTTKDCSYVLIEIASMITSEVRFLDGGDPEGELKLVEPRRQNVEYDVEHREGLFYLRVNDKGRNFRVVTVPVANRGKRNWTEVVPHNPLVSIQHLHLFRNHMVLETRQNSLPLIRVQRFSDGAAHSVNFPEPAYNVDVESNPNFESEVLRFTYSSLVTPMSVFDYDMNTRRRHLLKQDKVRGGYKAELYKTERVWAISHDGAKVPISIIYRKDVPKDGNAPLLLYAYGSYGYSREAEFNQTRLSLLNRGFVYAIAHIRGGAEMGEQWYDDGKLLHKKNTFEDMIAVAEHLVKKRYTSPKRLAIQGGSAGGMLMGAMANMRPDLFHAVVAMVPFVDVITTMLDASLPLTIGEYEEWGNPQEKKYYRYMKSYSPYDNVEAKAYPHILVTAGLNDPRVQYWEPAKWVAKLREMKTDCNDLLFKINMGGGHFGKSGRYEKFRETAFEFGFVLRVMGFAPNSK